MKTKRLTGTIAGALLMSLLSMMRTHAGEPSATEAAPSSPLPVAAPAAADAAPAGSQPSAAAEPAPVRTFDVLEYRVEGNRHLAELEIERAVYPHLGEKKTIQDVEAARAALEKAYHDGGYLTALVNIPEQRVAEGVITLQVIEAPVGRLHIAGSRYFSLGYIRARVPEFAQGSVPDFPEAQKELAQVNRPAAQVTPVLKPSATPGKVDVELKVKDQLPLYGSLEYNDRYGPNTTHTRAVAQLHYDNLWQLGHSIGFQYQIAPERPSDAKVASLSYVIPAGSVTWALYAVDSRSNVAAVGDINVIGNGDIYGLRMIKALPGNDRFFQSLTLGVDYKDFQQNVVLQGADTSDKSPIQYLPFMLQYEGTLNDGWGSTALDAGASFIVRGLFTDRDQFANKRAAAEPSYFIFKGGLQRTQKLPFKFSAVAKIDGQLADGPLISNEEFGAGGADSVRGYEESEELGDDGIHGSLELRSPMLFGGGEGSAIERFYLLMFVEGAHLRVRQPLPSQQPDFNLSSAGGGLRFKAKGVSLDVDAAHAFKDAADTKAGNDRVMFRGSYEF